MAKTTRMAGHSLMPLDEKLAFANITPQMPWLYESILKEIGKHNRGIESIVDVACGNGHLLSEIRERHPNIKLTGIDLDPQFVEEASKRDFLTVKVGDAHTFSSKGDLIVSNLGLHHFQDPIRAVQQMAANAQHGIIISDQLRPATEEGLAIRLEKRKQMLQGETEFYDDENERISILAAYTKDEAVALLRETGIPFSLSVVDADYYERLVAVSMPDIRALSLFEHTLNNAIENAKNTMSANNTVAVFDIRGNLYDLAHEVAPQARQEEIQAMYEWLMPQEGEIVADIAAGTGFLSKAIHTWTNAKVYAVDPSEQQLQALQRNCPEAVVPIQSFLDDPQIVNRLPQGINAITSLGGLHHVADQRRMFENMAMATLKGTRFIGADVCGGTALSEYFDTCVTNKCLTGHTATWLDENRLQEILRDLPWQIQKMECVPLHMTFNSPYEAYLFFKGLHAYDLDQLEILDDLQKALGTEERDGKFLVKWPLLIFELQNG